MIEFKQNSNITNEFVPTTNVRFYFKIIWKSRKQWY